MAHIIGMKIALIVVFCCLCCSFSKADFIVGGSLRMSLDSLPQMLELKATHIRTYAEWGYVQPKLLELEKNISVSFFRKNPSFVYEWIDTVSWTELDHVITTLINAGLTPIVEIGEGTVNCLPLYVPDNSPADPSVIGKELYLAYMYRFARAVVHRYKEKVHMYQLENELNEAFLETLVGVRHWTLFGNAWRDWDYVTEVLETLNLAVKDEDPTALTTTNLHTDVGKQFHELAFLKGYYLDALKSWVDLIDFVSFDAYPNMLVSTPICTSIIAERISEMKKVTDKDILLMETGYPVSAPNSTFVPDDLYFSEERQEEYATQVVEAVRSSGGMGVMYFGVWTSVGMIPPGGMYTDEDKEAMSLVGKAYLDEKALPLIKWAAEDHHIEYLKTRFKDIMDTISESWGVIAEDGRKRPAFYALQKEF